MVNFHLDKQFSIPSRFWPHFRNQRMAVIAVVFLLLLTVSTICSSWFTHYSPNEQGDLRTERLLPPSSSHWFGTDRFARDLFSRVMYGSRISLFIAFSVVILSLTFGLVYGTISGYFGGWVDTLLMRLLDFWLAFPAIFLIMTIIALFRPHPWYLIPVLSLTGWMETARLIRAEVLAVKTKEFILAAKGLGLNSGQILFRHVIPNCLNPIIVSAPLKIGEMILLESSLSFLGIGVQPPMASWGSIINDGREVLIQAWWVSAFPGLFIILTVMSFNLIGEGIRESLGIKK